MKKSASIVIGLGYGDEGKGLTTDYLTTTKKRPLVIRFNGGQQAGHTVVDETGRRHVFSNVGSGSLRGVPTYWSRFCTLSPGSLLNELQALQTKDCFPELYIDRQCYVTTHYDVLCNRLLELSRGKARHGSCGMGFGVTIERNEVAGISLLAEDLLDHSNLIEKLKEVRSYYSHKLKDLTVVEFDTLDHDIEDEKFLKYVQKIHSLEKQVRIVNGAELLHPDSEFTDFIFEGAQGIMLDMDFGHFPHVTRSNTCSKNALTMIREFYPELEANTELYYISRVYQTRHGAGPMTNTDLVPDLQNMEQETNVFNDHQGNFRVSALDLDQLNYAIRCDQQYSNRLKKNMVFTCADQLVNGQVLYTHDGCVFQTNLEEMLRLFWHSNSMENCYLSSSACGVYMERLPEDRLYSSPINIL